MVYLTWNIVTCQCSIFLPDNKALHIIEQNISIERQIFYNVSFFP